jgi:argininosuccinate lyase
MELTRGKAGRLIGILTGFLTTLKGLPTGYNKDLQEDKQALFAAFDTLSNLTPVITAIVLTLNVNPEKMRVALTEDMLATDLADYLVQKGLPFRQAHHVVGQIVRIAQDESINLSQVSLSSMRDVSDLFTDDVKDVFDFDKSVQRRSAPGGTAPDAVRQQIELAKASLQRISDS